MSGALAVGTVGITAAFGTAAGLASVGAVAGCRGMSGTACGVEGSMPGGAACTVGGATAPPVGPYTIGAPCKGANGVAGDDVAGSVVSDGVTVAGARRSGDSGGGIVERV